MGREILVDGYNVIKRVPAFQATRSQSLAAAREQLLKLLLNRYRHTPHQVIVVFDGDSPHEQMSHDRRLRVIFSRCNESADSVIARLATQARAEGREVELYSDDSEVQQAVLNQGGQALTTSQLNRQMHAAPKDVEQRARHRIAMIRQYGLDPAKGKDEDEVQPASRPGKKKKRR